MRACGLALWAAAGLTRSAQAGADRPGLPYWQQYPALTPTQERVAPRSGGTQRPERVSEALRQEISKIVHDELKDPRIGFVTITKVDLSKDLRFAKVYYSVMGEEKDRNLTIKGLNSARGYIKRLIGKRLGLKFTPEITFVVDKSLAYARHIYEVLDKIKKEREDKKHAD